VLPGKSIDTIYLMGYAKKRAEPGLALVHGSARVSAQPATLVVFAAYPDETGGLSGASPYQTKDYYVFKKLSRSCLPTPVIIDSGWNWTPWMG
jgi:hypothetical protein